MLLAFKVRYPDKVFLLRGNHEDAKINRIYGFYDECKRRFNVRLWKIFTDCFNCLPVAALIGDKILCMHGGLSPELQNLDQIKEIQRPTDVPDSGLLCDLLWSDPDSHVQGWGDSDRGVSFTFGPDRVDDFLAKNNLDLICRGHQVNQIHFKQGPHELAMKAFFSWVLFYSLMKESLKFSRRIQQLEFSHYLLRNHLCLYALFFLSNVRHCDGFRIIQRMRHNVLDSRLVVNTSKHPFLQHISRPSSALTATSMIFIQLFRGKIV